MPNQTIKSILERRSIRQYDSKQIKKTDLDLILKAGTYAPSGRGLQPSVIIAIQDKRVIKELSKINAEIFKKDTDPFFGAPTIVLVIANKESNNAIKDGSLVLGNMMLAAHSLGLGTCWVNRADEQMSYDYVQKMLEAIGIDHKDYIGVGHITIGYPKGEVKKASPRKENYIYKIV